MLASRAPRSKPAIVYSICRDTASSYEDRDRDRERERERDRDRDRESPNCELSDRDSRELDIHDPGSFDASNYDFYERSMGRSDGECMDGNEAPPAAIDRFDDVLN